MPLPTTTGLTLLVLPLVVLADVERIARCVAISERACAKSLGVQLKEPLSKAVSRVATPLMPFVASAEGDAVFKQLIAVNKHWVPAAADAIEGYAEGAGLLVRDAYVAAFANELTWFAKRAGFVTPLVAKKCTDYHSLGADVRAWVHNEDGDRADIDESYLIDATVAPTNTSSTRGSHRVAFVYGHDLVGGWAWSLNGHGLAQSVNALIPRNLTIGVTDSFLARHVAGAASLDEARRRACETPMAGGQHFNLGSIHEPNRQLMIEASNVGCDVRTLAPPPTTTATSSSTTEKAGDVTVGFHTNLYESAKLKGIDGGQSVALDGISSAHRMARMADLPPAKEMRALEAVVSDTQDATYPIHRTAAPPDLFMTLNSVSFDVAARRVDVWGQESPVGSGGQPLLTIDWATLRIERGGGLSRSERPLS